MRDVSRRDAVKLAAGFAGEAREATTVVRLVLHNWTDKAVALSVFGCERSLSTQVADSGEAFQVVGPSSLPKGEYVYVARTVAGDVVAYGKLKVVKEGPICATLPLGYGHPRTAPLPE